MAILDTLIGQSQRIPSIRGYLGRLVGTYLKRVTQNAYGCTYTVGTESGGSAIILTCQFTDVDGRAVAKRIAVTLGIFTDAACTTFNTGDFTLAAGAAGTVVQTIADQLMYVITNTSGVANISMTITGASTVYVGFFDSNGQLAAVSGAITHV